MNVLFIASRKQNWSYEVSIYESSSNGVLPSTPRLCSDILIVISGNDIYLLCMFRTYVHCGFVGMSMQSFLAWQKSLCLQIYTSRTTANCIGRHFLRPRAEFNHLTILCLRSESPSVTPLSGLSHAWFWMLPSVCMSNKGCSLPPEGCLSMSMCV